MIKQLNLYESKHSWTGPDGLYLHLSRNARAGNRYNLLKDGESRKGEKKFRRILTIVEDPVGHRNGDVGALPSSSSMNGTGRLRRGRSLRSEARPELGAAPPQKEAEFPAVCSGGRGLLTPRNPEKNAAGSGGEQFLAPGRDWFVLYPGAGEFLTCEPRRSDGKR